MLSIRPEQTDDIKAIRAVNEQAFGQKAEADLVGALRQNQKIIASLVAVDRGRIIGHILFSPVTIAGRTRMYYPSAGLAPMAVIPKRQREGIGTQLVEAGLRACRETGYNSVMVLGHPDFYPRFGFVPASRYGILNGFGAPDAAFMALELEPDALAQCAGTVQYQPEFMLSLNP